MNKQMKHILVMVAISAAVFAGCSSEEASESTPSREKPAPTAATESAQPEGLLAYWRCDNVVEIADLSGNGNTLTVRNGDDGVDVKTRPGGGLRFSGDDFAATADGTLANAIGAGSSTISCWFRTTNHENAKMLCGWYHRKPGFYIFELRLHGEDEILFNSQDSQHKDMNNGNNNARGGKGLDDGQWHHAAGVRDFGKTLSLYIDGVLAASTEDFGWELPADIPFYLSGLYNYTGDIDSVSVWSRALAADEVSALAEDRRAPMPKLK